MPLATCFIYTFISFDAFSGTPLLTRCHSVSSLFAVVFCFRKVVKEIFSELDKRNVKVLIFPGRFQNTEEETEEDPEGPTPLPGAAPLLPREHGVWGPRASTAFALSPTYTPRISKT